jgi:hypothetical protein
MLLAAVLIAGFLTAVAGFPCGIYAICGIGLQCAAEIPPVLDQCSVYGRRERSRGERSRWEALWPILPGLCCIPLACGLIAMFGFAGAPPGAQLSYLETGGVVTGFEWWRPANCWNFADTAQLYPGLACAGLVCRCDHACANRSAASPSMGGPLTGGGPAACLPFKGASLQAADRGALGLPVRECASDGDCGEPVSDGEGNTYVYDRCVYGRCVCGSSHTLLIYRSGGEARMACAYGPSFDTGALLPLVVAQLVLAVVAIANCCRAGELACAGGAQVRPAPPEAPPGAPPGAPPEAPPDVVPAIARPDVALPAPLAAHPVNVEHNAANAGNEVNVAIAPPM